MEDPDQVCRCKLGQEKFDLIQKLVSLRHKLVTRDLSWQEMMLSLSEIWKAPQQRM